MSVRRCAPGALGLLAATGCIALAGCGRRRSHGERCQGQAPLGTLPRHLAFGRSDVLLAGSDGHHAARARARLDGAERGVHASPGATATSATRSSTATTCDTNEARRGRGGPTTCVLRTAMACACSLAAKITWTSPTPSSRSSSIRLVGSRVLGIGRPRMEGPCWPMDDNALPLPHQETVHPTHRDKATATALRPIS